MMMYSITILPLYQYGTDTVRVPDCSVGFLKNEEIAAYQLHSSW
jgi:hypothetical protein